MVDTGMSGMQNNIYQKSGFSSSIKTPEIIDAPPSRTKNTNYNMTPLPDQKVGKIQNKNKSKLLGRDEKIEPDQYYYVKDENERLKKEKILTNEKIKKMEVQLANIKAQLIKERKLSDTRVINMDNSNLDKDFQATKLENEKLKDQNTKLRTYIKGLQSDKRTIPNFNKSKTNKKKVRNPLEAQRERNNDLALISHLREQLRNLNEDKNNLIQEITLLKSNGNFNPQSTLKSGKNTLNELSDIKTGYEKSNMRLDTSNKMLQLTRQSLQEMTEKYEKEKDKNRQLEARISLMKSNEDKLNDYQALIEEYKKREKILENRIEDLCDSPFIKQAEERGNIYRKFTENEKALNEAEKQNREYDLKNRQLEKRNKELESELKVALVDKDKYKDECTRLKISSEEREKNSKYFQEQFKLLSKYGEVDSNFNNLLNIMKLSTDANNWSNMNILEQMNNTDKSKDPVVLNKEIERLKIEKGTLGNELEKTKSLLQIQQQINEDMKKVQECDLKKYQAEIKKSKEKIEELCKLIDIKNLPKDYISKDSFGNPVVKDTKDLISSLLNEEKDVTKLQSKNMNDQISEFSRDEDEPEFSMNENAIDLYIGECEFEDGLDSEIGFNVDNMMSFLTVDFFIHETQTSNILSGKNPMFNFQLSFRVNVDEHLLNYLESDYIYIEIYYLRDNQQAILGKGKISLLDLINAETDNRTNNRVVNRICPCYSITDEGLKIASIHYKMRTRNPISEVLKFYYEQNKFIREINPVEEVNQREVEKTINDYSYIGGKVYEVKILVTKAVNLVCPGPPRRILPYFYYKFYKDYEKYSNISTGNDPQFQDVGSFTVVLDPSLQDYLSKELLNVYIFDSSNPIEVDVSNKESVKLVNTNQQIQQDLIGVCRIPLKNLLINDIIQGSFPIMNVNNREVGQLVINIFWQEIAQNDNIDGSSTFKKRGSLPYETKAFQDTLIIKLANALREKGLNVDSAFNIFDMDNKGEISIMNFTNTLLFTLKFTSNQNELNHLTQVIFTDNNLNSLNRIDFYKIFAMLLPHEGPAENLINQSINQNQNFQTVPNMITNNDTMKFTINSNRESRTIEPEKVDDENNTNTLKSSNVNNTFKTSTFNLDKNNLSTREVNEICNEIKKKMINTGKSSAIDLFKIFDKDSSSNLSKNELKVGLQKLGVNVSNNEIDKLMDKITEKKGDNSASFGEFKKFFEKNIAWRKTNESQMRTNNNNSIYRQSSFGNQNDNDQRVLTNNQTPDNYSGELPNNNFHDPNSGYLMNSQNQFNSGSGFPMNSQNQFNSNSGFPMNSQNQFNSNSGFPMNNNGYNNGFNSSELIQSQLNQTNKSQSGFN